MKGGKNVGSYYSVDMTHALFCYTAMTLPILDHNLAIDKRDISLIRDVRCRKKCER